MNTALKNKSISNLFSKHLSIFFRVAQMNEKKIIKFERSSESQNFSIFTLKRKYSWLEHFETFAIEIAFISVT